MKAMASILGPLWAELFVGFCFKMNEKGKGGGSGGAKINEFFKSIFLNYNTFNAK